MNSHSRRSNQADLPLFEVAESNQNIDWLVAFLSGREWTTANEILRAAGKPEAEQGRRWVRALADTSRGRVAGGQKGYKLVSEMTAGEFQHTRNWMLSQAANMQRRVAEMDKVFYARKEIPK